MTDSRKRILLIVNPASGMLKSKDALLPILTVFSEREFITSVLTTSGAGDAAAFAGAYAETHDLVVCCGGDGTLNEVLSGMLKAGIRKPVGLIPCGTTNDVAHTMNLPCGSNLTNAAVVAAAGRAIPHDIGVFNDSRIFSYVASFGAFTKVSYDTPQWLKNMFRHFAYVLDGIASVGDIHPQKMQVRTGGTVIEGEFIFGSVTNATSVGGVVKLNERDVRVNDGKFEILLIKNPRKPSDLTRILSCLKKQQYDGEFVYLLSEASVEFCSACEVPWTVDGERAGSPKNVKIVNLHNAVTMIYPEE